MGEATKTVSAAYISLLRSFVDIGDRNNACLSQGSNITLFDVSCGFLVAAVLLMPPCCPNLV